MNPETKQVLYALLVCTLAGLCTLIGSLFVFIKTVKKTNHKILAIGNAFAAGVMAFVSYCEILQVKSVEEMMKFFIKKSNITPDTTLEQIRDAAMVKGMAVSYSLFFIGCILCCLINMGAHYIIDSFDLKILSFENMDAESPNSSGKLEAGDTTAPSDTFIEGKQLCLMSLDMFIALTLHNIPEGIATFILTYQDPSVGITLAIAIAAHNVPEGIAISLPVYYATGRKLYAFLFALLASIAEPIGGIIGLIVIKATRSVDNHLFLGISFGIVSGIMMWVVIYEMLPVSFRYSKSAFLISVSFFLGSLLMAVSLVLMK